MRRPFGLSSQSAHLCLKLCILGSSLMTIVLDMTLPMVRARLWRYLIVFRLWFWQAKRAANSAVTCMAHWVARPRWWSASSRSSACTAASLAAPVTGVSLSTRRRDHVFVEGVSGRVFRALPASRARRVENVLVRSLRVRALLLFRKDLDPFRSEARRLGFLHGTMRVARLNFVLGETLPQLDTFLVAPRALLAYS